ncbi:diaminopropionate ammonia-lyase [Virgibacillus sp. W0430]|uniref:diaminopropionate ammonia-lyase n=1 Tax=Virgibacillus sp. W0430 TaxID=3391580 RepID=UPI003F451A70
MEKTAEKNIKWVKNKSYSSTYNDEELAPFSTEHITNVLQFQKSHSAYKETPYISLKELARYLKVADISVKDESKRFGLNAFKVMGGIYAVGKYLAQQLGKDISDLSFADLQLPEVKEQLGELTFISATDGNHGKGIAWAARELGHKSVIYMPKGSSHSRLEAIRNEGAFSEVTNMNYDATVRMCADLADENGWILVQDTAWEGYDEVPLWIMQGYAGIAKEMIDDLERSDKQAPTHLILQAGVGSFAAGIAAYFKEYYKDQCPTILVVEPNLADCYYRSFSSATGDMEVVTGHMNSIMAGLCCGEPNNRAFRILKQYASASFSCDDRIAALGMRVLGNPLTGDKKIVSGESGAVPLGLLFALREEEDEQICAELGLDEQARIAIINTEGDTDYQHYLDIVWKGHYPND